MKTVNFGETKRPAPPKPSKINSKSNPDQAAAQTEDPAEMIDKISHILGTISKECELSTGITLTIKPAKTGQVMNLYTLMNDITDYFAKKRAKQAAGVPADDPLLLELEKDLSQISSELISARLDQEENPTAVDQSYIGKLEAKQAILQSQIAELKKPVPGNISKDLESLLTVDAAPFFVEYGDKLTQTMINLSGFPGTKEDLMDLPFADTIQIFVSVIGVNLDFFAKRLKPLMIALGEIRNILGMKRQRQLSELNQALKNIGNT